MGIAYWLAILQVVLAHSIAFRGHTLWKRERNHDGLLAIDVHPNGELFASAGQDGRILIYNALTGKEKSKTIEVGPEWVEHIAWSPDWVVG